MIKIYLSIIYLFFSFLMLSFLCLLNSKTLQELEAKEENNPFPKEIMDFVRNEITVYGVVLILIFMIQYSLILNS
jgi:hypothetical protein